MAQKTHVMHGRDHVPTGADPIPGFPPSLSGGDTLDSAIAALDPSGFWKLNESSGSTAFDSSGNGLDLVADTGPPIWAQPAGPPGEQTANFNTGTASYPPPSGTAARVARYWATLTSSFTTGIWAKREATGSTTIMGQGNPSRSGGTGWEVGADGTGHFYATMKGAGGVTAVNPTSVGVWAFVALVYDASTLTFKLYVDGVLQGTSSPATFSPAPALAPFYVGHDAGLGGNAYSVHAFSGSYAMYFPVALSGAEILDIFTHAGTTGLTASGLVLTSNGLGASAWEEPTIRVTSPAGRYDELTLGSGLSGTDNGDGSITLTAAGGGGAPTGAAGGALDGSYPNPGIAASVAGAGLAETSDVLSVNVDGATLEINADALRVKADGITATQIAASAVGASELASTAVTPGSYGDATHVATFTVDQDGRLTAAGSATITGSGGAAPTDSRAWMPLTTTNTSGDDVLVFDDDHSLIPTLVAF